MSYSQWYNSFFISDFITSQMYLYSLKKNQLTIDNLGRILTIVVWMDSIINHVNTDWYRIMK